MTNSLCSIQAGEDIWVVCPRRLFAAKFDGQDLPPTNRALQQYERALLIQAGLPQETDIGAWAEVSLNPHSAGFNNIELLYF